MNTTTPYDWVKHVEPELLKHDEIPLTGNHPSFPWEQFAAQLAKCFEIQDLTIKADTPLWRTSKGLFEGLGDHLSSLQFVAPSMEGSVYWVMPQQEVDMLMSAMLTKQEHPSGFQDPELVQSFYQFLFAEILFQISHLDFDKSIMPSLTSKTELPAEDALCIDVSAVIQSHSFWGRLIITPAFRRSWAEKHTSQHPTARTQEIAKQADVIVHVEVGKVSFSIDEWSKVKPGDFIMLDQCSLEPSFTKGHLTLSSNNRPIFSAELNNGNLTIIENTTYYKVENP